MNRRDRRSLKFGHDPRNVYRRLDKGARALPDREDVETTQKREQEEDQP